MVNPREFELLTNTEFVEQFSTGIATANRRIYIQVMTFDGDDSGLGIAELLVDAAARGVDVRLTVDLFAFRYVSDTHATDEAVHDEAAATHAMFDRLEAAGVDVTYVGPWGPLLMFGPVRSHKKIFVIDDTVYLGGINISDHNFEWFDLAVRTQSEAIVEESVADFLQTRRGERTAKRGAIVTNEQIEVVFDELISNAKESILVVSPYALDPDLDRRLAAASAPSKTVVSPQSSNYWTLRQTDHYMRERLLRRGITLKTFSDFFHAKFLLVDEKTVLIGSSNFGRHSFRCNQEICIVIDDEVFVESLISAMPELTPAAHESSRLRYLLGMAAQGYLFTGIGLLERIVVPRAPVLASR